MCLILSASKLQNCLTFHALLRRRSAAPPAVEGDESAAASAAAPPPPVVTSVAWRADGVVLAVGYSGGHLCLFEIDKSDPIHFNQKVSRSMDAVGIGCRVR